MITIAYVFVFFALLEGVYASKVLVIGGSGRVGASVVSKLVNQGVPTTVMVRNIEAAQTNEKLKGASLVQGDVCNMEDIMKATYNCTTIIDVHGPKPPRFSKLRDIFLHPKSDPTHPYNVQFLGIKRILSAMEVNKVKKLVRITGSLVDKNTFLPFVFLFNFLLSKTIKWHEMSEIAIRKSGVDYTVIRPPGIREHVKLSDDESSPRHLRLVAGDGGKKLKSRGQISVNDLAELCVLAAEDERLSKRTVLCAEELGSGSKSWKELIQSENIPMDNKKIKKRLHNLSLLLYTSLFATFFSSLVGGVFVALRCLIKAVLPKIFRASVTVV